MNQGFGTKQVEGRPFVGVRTSTTMDKIGEVMGPLFGEVYAHIQQSGQQPAGMPFAMYHSMDNNTVDLECGMPVASPVEGAGRVKAGELPGRDSGDRDSHRTVRRPPADVVVTRGVDGVAGPPARGRALGGLRHRPWRRARPIEVAYRHILPRALTGRTPRLMPPWRVSWPTLSGSRFRATAHLIDSGDTCRFYPAPFRSSATGESVSFCFGRICRPSNRGRPQAIFESVSSRRQAGMGRSAPRIGRDPVPNRRAAGQATQRPRPCGRWLACEKNSTDVRRNQ